MQRRNRIFFYFYVASLSKSFYMHFWSRRNTVQPLRHIINQPLALCVLSVQYLNTQATNQYCMVDQAWDLSNTSTC